MAKSSTEAPPTTETQKDTFGRMIAKLQAGMNRQAIFETTNPQPQNNPEKDAMGLFEADIKHRHGRIAADIMHNPTDELPQ